MAEEERDLEESTPEELKSTFSLDEDAAADDADLGDETTAEVAVESLAEDIEEGPKEVFEDTFLVDAPTVWVVVHPVAEDNVDLED